MVSRLDRLFILLDTGSNESIRLAAAKQLGEVQRLQPNDLNYLLRRIKEYSSKLVWETRIAAGQATGCVLEQVVSWPPNRNCLDQDEKSSSISTDSKQVFSSINKDNINTENLFDQFNPREIVSLFPMLLSIDTSDGDDQEPAATSSKGRYRRESKVSSKKNDKEQLMRQRKLINKELGISMVDSLNLGVKSTDIVTNDDLQDHETSKSSQPTSSSQDARSKLHDLISNYDKITRILLRDGHIQENRVAAKSDNDEKCDSVDKNEWPLTNITNQYVDDLFNPAWEVRHGAAIALREIVRLQGRSAGKRFDLDDTSNYELNQLWLVDMAIKALCVLVLDKFGDFLFDQVVAPVRENAAQLLSCCVAAMSEENAYKTFKILLKILENSGWEVRHGGILGLKYALSIMDDSFIRKFLVECFDPIFKLLGDSVDDVSAEAAAALVPVKDLLIEVIPDETPHLIRFLWEHLADLDELTTSTSNIVLLLASLITASSAKLDPSELNRSLPRLWPLIGHSSTSVRISVMKALITLIKTQKSTCLSWMPVDLITTALRLIFQRSILENMDEVRPLIEEVWILLLQIDATDPTEAAHEIVNLLRFTSQYLNYWLCLIMQPFNSPIDRGSPMWLNLKSDGTISSERPDGEVYIGSITFNAETMNQQKTQATKCRLLATKMIGALYAKLVSGQYESQHATETLKYLSDMFVHYLRTKSANQRLYSGWALESWANQQSQIVDESKLKSSLPPGLIDQLRSAIQDTTLCYDELASLFTRLQQETREFVSTLADSGISSLSNLPATNDRRTIYNLTQIQSLCDLNIADELNRAASKKAPGKNRPDVADVIASKAYALLGGKKNLLNKSMKSTIQSQKTLSISVLSSLACAHIAWHIIPDKLNLMINPLLDSIELEEDQLLQEKSIRYLIALFDVLCRDQEKFSEQIEIILQRLIKLLVAKEINGPARLVQVPDETGSGMELDKFKIILLDNLQRKADQNRALTRRQSSVSSNGPNLKRSLSLSSSNELDGEQSIDLDQSRANTQSLDQSIRGIRQALSGLVKHFGEKLPKLLPMFWRLITDDILEQIKQQFKGTSDIDTTSDNETQLIKNLLLLETVGENIHQNLHGKLVELFEKLITLLSSTSPMLRHRTSQCLGVISKLMFKGGSITDLIGKTILPMLTQDDDKLARCGAIETVASIIEHLQLELIPCIDMFIVHVLRRMSDQNDQIRLMATHCFGKLLSLMPLNLEKDKSDSEPMRIKSEANTNEQQQVSEDHRFIEQLMDPKKLENFEIPFKMNAELRSYQQDGLNWLSFLNRYNLHGILCDEMGLGKTFMTISMVASDHYLMREKSSQPSLIVCPSTLTEHWLYEIIKFVPDKIRSALNPVAYTGNVCDRMQIRNRILKATGKSGTNGGSGGGKALVNPINLVVSSYDIIRNDIDFFKAVNWNYCVLDEGHIIKNVKTKLSRAIRLLQAKHRLILSGTPIQNNVTELWSLFDFLMPGFLGSERQFYHRYSKPILQSREPKCSSREQEAGALAMESLHRQVLPFILRRLKEDVLDDLPPKIIQDYYCELSPLQQRLYEDFTRSRLCKDVTRKSLGNLVQKSNECADQQQQQVEDEKEASSKSHVFQALQYLKNVCNHPKLVLTPKHSEYLAIKKTLDAEKSSLDDIAHSSKLKALKQLLIDCGIGVANMQQATGSENQPQQSGQQQQQQDLAPLESVVNQHRALIFCQVRSMVNIIENDLFKKHLPNITYLRLDGSIATNQRHSIVSRFNDDPSIDILLLTTKIGGLGLNLTGADTVIFVEHDWNPTKDLQAMDRAHRIGQRKVVNVYRLITKSTLEEKIMGLQKFKTMVSNTVINQDNAGLGTMNVDQLFDLFGGDWEQKESKDDDKRTGNTSSSSFIDLLPELWDQQQYETEYDLSSFVSSLKST